MGYSRKVISFGSLRKKTGRGSEIHYTVVIRTTPGMHLSSRGVRRY